MVPAGAFRGPPAADHHPRLPPVGGRGIESVVDRIRGRHAGRGRGNRRRLCAGVLAHPEKAGRPACFPVGGAAVLPAIPVPVLLPRLYGRAVVAARPVRSEEHTSELQSLMRISYAVFCLKKKKQKTISIKDQT